MQHISCLAHSPGEPAHLAVILAYLSVARSGSEDAAWYALLADRCFKAQLEHLERHRLVTSGAAEGGAGAAGVSGASVADV